MGEHYKRPFRQRISFKTEPAEVMFERWADGQGINWHRLGMDRPAFNFVPQIPSIIRATPDYLAEATDHPLKTIKPRHFLVECKGCGKDQTIKVKFDSLADIERWQEWASRPVIFFFYDSHGNRISPVNTVEAVKERCADAEVDKFPDNHRPYYKLTTDMFDWWDAPEEAA